MELELSEFTGTSAERREEKEKARAELLVQREFIENLKMNGVKPPSCEFLPDCMTIIKMMRKTCPKEKLKADTPPINAPAKKVVKIKAKKK